MEAPPAPCLSDRCGSRNPNLPASGTEKSRGQDHIHGAEACLMPILVMALCTLLTWADPMGPLSWVAYSLVAFSTTFLAMGLREKM
jgi:hypothetical protein